MNKNDVQCSTDHGKYHNHHVAVMYKILAPEWKRKKTAALQTEQVLKDLSIHWTYIVTVVILRFSVHNESVSIAALGKTP